MTAEESGFLWFKTEACYIASASQVLGWSACATRPSWRITSFIKKVVGVCPQYLRPNLGAQVPRLRRQLLLCPCLPDQALGTYVKCYATCLPLRGPDPWAATEVALGCVTGSG